MLGIQAAGGNPENDRITKLNQLYFLIISKYKDYIEEKEEISVAELPRFVMPQSGFVAKKAAELKEKFTNYTYDKDFADAALTAFHFVRDETEDIVLPLQFWLSPEETLKFMGGDITDRNILLCSLLIALGNPSSKVIIVTDDSKRAVKAYYEFNNSIRMFDIENGTSAEFAAKDDMIKSLNLNDESIAYEFNDQMYVDIA